MRAPQFDRMTTLFGQPRTRRGALRLLCGALASAGMVARQGRGEAAGVGTAKDWRDLCEIAGGIPAEGVDGSFNCVFNNGFEVHCSRSGVCRTHCWDRYGCDCSKLKVDVCHHEEMCLGDDEGIAVSPGGEVLAPVKESESSGLLAAPDDRLAPIRRRRKRRSR